MYEVIIFLIIVLLVLMLDTESMTMPDRSKRTKEILENKKLFGGDASYQQTRENLTWLDPVTFYDMNDLLKKNQFTESNIANKL